MGAGTEKTRRHDPRIPRSYRQEPRGGVGRTGVLNSQEPAVPAGYWRSDLSVGDMGVLEAGQLEFLERRIRGVGTATPVVPWRDRRFTGGIQW